MFRLSMIRNYPVVCENKRIGLLLGMRFDLHAKRVTSLVVSCGFRGKRMISSSHVNAVADGFILVQDAQMRLPLQDCTETVFAFDTTGLLVGRVIDWAIDESSMTVQALEIVTGYLPGMYTKRIWIFEYECKRDGEIIIPASFVSGLTTIVKEEVACG